MRKIDLSVIILTKNNERIIENCLKSISFAKEIIIVDSGSKDKTLDIAKKLRAKIFFSKSESFGFQRNLGIEKATMPWILFLDSDERVSANLKKEMFKVLKEPKLDAYWIPIASHFGQKRLFYGGENYRKLILFKKEIGKCTNQNVGEHIEVEKDAKVGRFRSSVFHYSYQSFWQVLKKFTFYARLEAKDRLARRERVTPKKMIFYPIHMFWARYFKEKGWKDKWRGFLIAWLFSYMEFVTFLFLFLQNIKRKIRMLFMAKKQKKSKVQFKISLKTLKVPLIVFLLLAIVVLLYYFKSLFVVALVNGQPITRFAFNRTLEKQAGGQILDAMMTEILIYQEAKKKNIKISQEEMNKRWDEVKVQLSGAGSDLEQILALQGMTEKDFRRQIELRLLIEKIVGQNIQVTDEEITDYYKENKATLGDTMDKEKIKEALSQQKISQEFETWLDDLKGKAQIHYFINL